MRIRWNIVKDMISGKGQSLVELALFFPVLLIILAGIVEVSNLLNTQNKIISKHQYLQHLSHNIIIP